MSYSYNVPKLIVNLIHIIIGIWLIAVGYRLLTKVKIKSIEKYILIILGIVVILYQSWLWYKFPNKDYSFNLNGWIVHLGHILIGIFLMTIGILNLKNKKVHNILDIILIVLGTMAALYHLHLMIFT